MHWHTETPFHRLDFTSIGKLPGRVNGVQVAFRNGAYQISRTSRVPRARETQAHIQPSARFSGVSTESRWSTSPSSTFTRHVPHFPSVQPVRMSTPCARAASASDSPAGTSNVISDSGISTRNARLLTPRYSPTGLTRLRGGPHLPQNPLHQADRFFSFYFTVPECIHHNGPVLSLQHPLPAAGF